MVTVCSPERGGAWSSPFCGWPPISKLHVVRPREMTWLARLTEAEFRSGMLTFLVQGHCFHDCISGRGQGQGTAPLWASVSSSVKWESGSADTASCCERVSGVKQPSASPGRAPDGGYCMSTHLLLSPPAAFCSGQREPIFQGRRLKLRCVAGESKAGAPTCHSPHCPVLAQSPGTSCCAREG